MTPNNKKPIKIEKMKMYCNPSFQGRGRKNKVIAD